MIKRRILNQFQLFIPLFNNTRIINNEIISITQINTHAQTRTHHQIQRPTVIPNQSNQSKNKNNFRSLSINTILTPNEDALKFVPSTSILPKNHNAIEFTNVSRLQFQRFKQLPPLIIQLFAINGIESVLLGRDFITIEKISDINWSLLKPSILSVLLNFFTRNNNSESLSKNVKCQRFSVENTQKEKQNLKSQHYNGIENDNDNEIILMINEVLETRIRPMMHDDGGDLEFRGFLPDGTVLLKLQGACKNCDSSSLTLKNGIESVLIHYIEEVKKVKQVY